MEKFVIFDCERMKHPNVGLYFFCKQLANNLITEAEQRKQNLALYVPKSLKDTGEITYNIKQSLPFISYLYPALLKLRYGIFQTKCPPIFHMVLK